MDARISLVSAILLALAHIFAGKLRFLEGTPRSAWLSAASGVSVAYVFVHLLPDGRWPHTAATLGSNSAHLQATVDISSGRVIVSSAIDNLGKGAAGQAVQCANLVLGLPETTGLAVDGVAP